MPNIGHHAFRDRVDKWISANENKTAIRRIIQALAFQTEWDQNKPAEDRFYRLVVEGFIEQIDDIANNLTYTQANLSERLANAGLLPMFGFPTRVRDLYTRFPSTAPQLRNVGRIDRDLDIAISQFAPGSQTVKRQGNSYRFGSGQTLAGRRKSGQSRARISSPRCTNRVSRSAYVATAALLFGSKKHPLQFELVLKASEDSL